jgi:hypothetical protein
MATGTGTTTTGRVSTTTPNSTRVTAPTTTRPTVYNIIEDFSYGFAVEINGVLARNRTGEISWYSTRSGARKRITRERVSSFNS